MFHKTSQTHKQSIGTIPLKDKLEFQITRAKGMGRQLNHRDTNNHVWRWFRDVQNVLKVIWSQNNRNENISKISKLVSKVQKCSFEREQTDLVSSESPKMWTQVRKRTNKPS